MAPVGLIAETAGARGRGPPADTAVPFNIRQLTDVLQCKLQKYLRCNRHRARQLRNRVEAMAPTRPTELHQCRFRLTREPTAAAEARGQVRAVIGAWRVPVDPDIAVLLTSDLVTSVIMFGNGETVMLVIGCRRGHLRIDVYDASRLLPIAADEPAGYQTRRGLALVAALSTEWGSFRTPAGKAVYFTLAFQPDPHIQEKTPTSEGVTWQAPPSGVRTNARVQAVAGSRAP